MAAGLVVWLVKHVLAPIIIYMVVSSWSIIQGVDPIIGNIIGAAAAFGTLVVSFKIGG